MNWIRRDPHHFESDCRNYRISIAMVAGWCRYTAWRREVQEGEPFWWAVEYLADMAAAKRVCEEDTNGC